MGAGKIPLTAILAGGKARRMGVDKLTLPLAGVPLLERTWSRVAPVSERVIAVGGPPLLASRSVETIPDLYPGADSMGGLATALAHAAATGGPGAWALCVACDLPLLEPALLAYLGTLQTGWDAVVPRTPAGWEPLCAVYRATCLPALEEEIRRGNLRIRDLFALVRTREVGPEELRRFDADLRSFLNVNRPADLARAQELLGAGPPEGVDVGSFIRFQSGVE
ncbi:MAG: molybdenum cofactor guanylyltransferase [Deltaproteobacteria bacterium]|nr:molybdenum cofactor guanylyltransferase [Deltaproteobacteria bacterium]